MKSILFFLLFLFISSLSYSQLLYGVIHNAENNAIPYATIFIKELNMGTTSNSQGEYKFNIAKGNYTIQYRSIGFEQELVSVIIDSVNVEKNIELTEQSYQLHEIRVYKDNVDPAYPIMRRVIAMAPYYLNQIKEYKAEVYLKGTAKLEKVPKLFQKNFKIDIDGTAFGLGDVYVGESFSEIEFNAPDVYHQKIISSNMSILNDHSSTFDMELITESPYQSVIGDNIITPVSPQAFSHYNFRYDGYYQEGEYLVNKIRILPKRKSKQLFSGYLYVVDGLWCLRGLELELDQGVIDLHIDIQLAEVEKGILLPISHIVKVNGKVLGIAGYGEYSSSVKYQLLSKNDNLELPALLQVYYADEKVKEEIVNQTISKRSKKIEKIMAKNDLTKGDAIRLARLMKKEAELAQPKKETSFEIVDTYHKETNDSATVYSKEYWELMRPNPLSVEELKSYQKADSLMLIKVEAVDTTTIEKSKIISKIVRQKNFSFKNDSIQLYISSLFSPSLISFNAVEGLKYRQEFRYKQTLKNNQLEYKGGLAYSFGQRNIQWNLQGIYRFAPLHRGVFQYSSGNNVVDYNGSEGISPIVNTISSLFFKENYARYHQQKYFTMKSEFELFNGFLISGEFDYINRTHLQNNTNFSFFQRDANYEVNEISNSKGNLINIIDGKSAIVNLGLEYTPMNYYRIDEGKKVNVSSSWPTFIFYYKKGLRGLYNSTSDWDLLELGLRQKIVFGIANELNYSVKASWFIANQLVSYADFLRVKVSSVPVEVKDQQFAFMLLPYYAFNTKKQLFTAGVNYKTPLLILKYLPWISKQNWFENISCNFLSSPDLNNYVELGYGLSNLIFNSEVGVYSSFENGKYRQTGVKAILRF